jgi:hypothetical protein
MAFCTDAWTINKGGARSVSFSLAMLRSGSAPARPWRFPDDAPVRPRAHLQSQKKYPLDKPVANHILHLSG